MRPRIGTEQNHSVIMIFTNQDRSRFVILSPFTALRVNSAKDLARWAMRCFAALSMTVSALVVKVHNRASTGIHVAIFIHD